MNNTVISFKVPYEPEQMVAMCKDNPKLVIAIVVKYHFAHQWKNQESFELALDAFFQNLAHPSNEYPVGFPNEDDDDDLFFDDDRLDVFDDEDDDFLTEDDILLDCGRKIMHGHSTSCSCGNHPGFVEVLI